MIELGGNSSFCLLLIAFLAFLCLFKSSQAEQDGTTETDYQIALSKAQTTHMIKTLHINSSGLVYEKEEIRRSERSFLGRKFSLDCAPAALLIASVKIVENAVILYNKTTDQPGIRSRVRSERKKQNLQNSIQK